MSDGHGNSDMRAFAYGARYANYFSSASLVLCSVSNRIELRKKVARESRRVKKKTTAKSAKLAKQSQMHGGETLLPVVKYTPQRNVKLVVEMDELCGSVYVYV